MGFTMEMKIVNRPCLTNQFQSPDTFKRSSIDENTIRNILS